MTTLDVAAVTRRFVILTALRWLPTGLLVPILVLLFTSRGFSLTQYAAIATVMTTTTFLLELPTGGLADSLGRKRVLLIGNGFLLASGAGLAWLAFSPTRPPMGIFLVLVAAMGVYRALESGPLEAWYVDAVHAAGEADVSPGLGRAGGVTGFSIAAGSLLSGGIIALDPFPAVDSMGVVVLTSMALVVIQVAALALLMVETRPSGPGATWTASVRQVPSVITGTLRLARTSRVITLLLLVEATWVVGMVSFENLFPVRLEALVGTTEGAASLMGPVSAAAWAASGLGAALIVRLSRRIGEYPAAALLRVCQGATIVVMGLAAGTPGLIAAFIATYLSHGASAPVHMTLLHRQVTAANRTTAVSLNSMVGFAAFSVAAVLIGLVADGISVEAGMFICGAVAVLGAPLYLRARRHDTTAPGTETGEADAVMAAGPGELFTGPIDGSQPS